MAPSRMATSVLMKSSAVPSSPFRAAWEVSSRDCTRPLVSRIVLQLRQFMPQLDCVTGAAAEPLADIGQASGGELLGGLGQFALHPDHRMRVESAMACVGYETRLHRFIPGSARRREQRLQHGVDGTDDARGRRRRSASSSIIRASSSSRLTPVTLDRDRACARAWVSRKEASCDACWRPASSQLTEEEAKRDRVVLGLIPVAGSKPCGCLQRLQHGVDPVGGRRRLRRGGN